MNLNVSNYEIPIHLVNHCKEFIAIKEELENYEDIREAKESSIHEDSIPFSKVVKDLDLE